MSSCCSLLIYLTLDSVQRMVTYEGLVCQRIRKSRNWSRLCLSGCLCLDHAPEQWQGYDCGYDPVEQMKNKGPSSKRCVGQVSWEKDCCDGYVYDYPDCDASQNADPDGLLSRGQSEPPDCGRRSDEQ